MKISVITVCLNSEQTIEKTIKSVLSQKYLNYEYIVIDGGSSDSTLKIIKKYQKFLKTVVSIKDKGIFDAINKGIELAEGDIISIIHSDDIYYNNEVFDNVLFHFKSNLNLDCLIGTTIINKYNSNKIIRKYNPKIFKNWMLYFGFSPPHPSSFIKKKIYDDFGMYKIDYKIAGDFEFFLRIILKNKISFKILDKNFVIMKSGGKSSKSFISNIISTKEILKSFRENEIYTNLFLVLLRFPLKLIQMILK